MTVCTVMGENPFSHYSKTPNTTLVPIEMVALGDSCGNTLNELSCPQVRLTLEAKKRAAWS